MSERWLEDAKRLPRCRVLIGRALPLRSLAFVSREIMRDRVMLVGAYRDQGLDRLHPLTGTLAALSALPGFERTQLAGLSVDKLNALEVSLTDTEAPSGHVLFERTDGNPLYASLLIGSRIDFSDTQNLPRGLRDVIIGRMRSMPVSISRGRRSDTPGLAVEW